MNHGVRLNYTFVPYSTTKTKFPIIHFSKNLPNHPFFFKKIFNLNFLRLRLSIHA